MSRKRKRLHSVAAILSTAALLGACASAPPPGPGMTVQFGNGIAGTNVLVDAARTADGRPFPGPGSLAPQAHPLAGGKTMGAAQEHRSLPQWVEFTWIELPYESTHEYTPEELAAVPEHRERVVVRERVPADVVASVMANKERSLRIHFIWQRDGIAFHWQERSGCCTKLREGGDRVE